MRSIALLPEHAGCDQADRDTADLRQVQARPATRRWQAATRAQPIGDQLLQVCASVHGPILPDRTNSDSMHVRCLTVAEPCWGCPAKLP